MKVLHLIPNLQKGGAERLCLDIVKHLSLQGIEVRLATLNNINDYTSEYPHLKIDVLNSIIAPSISGKWEINTKAYDSLLEEFKPDIIHTHLFEADFLAHYKIYKTAKYITHFHDNMHQLSKFNLRDIKSKKRITELYERNFLLKKYKEANNYFIAISADTLRYINNVIPNSLKKHVTLLHNGIDLSVFKNSRLYDNNQVLTLINIGSFVAKKNQRFLIDVALELKNKNIAFKLLLAGDGALKAQVEQFAQEKMCSDSITFLGKTSNIHLHLQKASVYIHSATYEPFGLAIIEAMASGLPVVCLNGKGNADIIQNEINGYILNKPDSKLFAECIIKIHSDKQLYDSMSKSAIATSEKYDITKYTQKLIAFYKSIL